MGNRAVIGFEQDKKRDKKSVGIYLHWNGGRDSVEGFLKVAKDYGIDLRARLGKDIQTTTDQLNAVDKLLYMGVPINKAVNKIYPESYKDIFGKSRSKYRFTIFKY